MLKRTYVFILLLMIPLFFCSSCRTSPHNPAAEKGPVAEKDLTDIQPAQKTENQDNCDPPPPCLDPWERPIRFYLKDKLTPTERLKVLASIKSNTPANYTIQIQKDENKHLYMVTCTQPFRLPKEKNGNVKLFIQNEESSVKTLEFVFREEIISCCPHLVADQIKLGNKILCENCPGDFIIEY
jgi:hypothetical protein